MVRCLERLISQALEVLVLVVNATKTAAHAIAYQWAELFKWEHALTGHSLVRLVAVVAVAKLITFDVLVQQIGLFHDSVAHGDVRIVKGHPKQVRLVDVPEIDSLLQTINQLIHFLLY